MSGQAITAANDNVPPLRVVTAGFRRRFAAHLALHVATVLAFSGLLTALP